MSTTMNMVYGNATTHWQDWKKCVQSWKDTASRDYPIYSVYLRPIMEAYQEIYQSTTQEIISYIHDDVIINEPDWDLRVAKEFEDPSVGMVGFGGATGHCHPQLYEVPFNWENMGRHNFLSNMRTAEDHGQRFTGERDVVVLDGFAMFVRRSILDKWGGWPQNTTIGYWVYDYAISCEVRHQGYRIRLVGVDCDHLGGKSPSIKDEDIVGASKWLYDRYYDVLPAECD